MYAQCMSPQCLQVLYTGHMMLVVFVCVGVNSIEGLSIEQQRINRYTDNIYISRYLNVYHHPQNLHCQIIETGPGQFGGIFSQQPLLHILSWIFKNITGATATAIDIITAIAAILSWIFKKITCRANATAVDIVTATAANTKLDLKRDTCSHCHYRRQSDSNFCQC